MTRQTSVVRAIVALLIGGLVAACGAGASNVAVSPGQASGDAHLAPHVAGEVLVRVFPNADRNAVAAAVGGSIVSEIRQLDVLRLRIGGRSVVDAIKTLQARPDVLYAEPNYTAQIPELGQQPSAQPSRGLPSLSQPGAMAVPNDPAYPHKLWGLVKINAETAWATTTGSSTVVVAVLDTGVDAAHPDLAGKLLTGVNCLTGTCTPGGAGDVQGHGTHVAGTAAAIGNDGVGVVGVAFNPVTQILPVKVLGDDGRGTFAGIAAGIIWATDFVGEMGRKGVLNMSLGGFGYSQVMQDAMAHANRTGNVLVVVSMGNDFKRHSVIYPAGLTGAMAVGATDGNDNKVDFSSTGLHISVAAPGQSVYSSIPGGRWAYKSGTSMASPHVAGLAALVWSVFPTWNSYQVRRKIEITAQDLGTAGWDESFGWGRIRADAAVVGAPPPTFYGCAEISVRTVTPEAGNVWQAAADVIMTMGTVRKTSKTGATGVHMDFLPTGSYTVTASKVIGGVEHHGTATLSVTGAGAPATCNATTITIAP
jgi:subtilisin family serine protease